MNEVKEKIDLCFQLVTYSVELKCTLESGPSGIHVPVPMLTSSKQLQVSGQLGGTCGS